MLRPYLIHTRYDYLFHRQPKRCWSSLDFEFIREYMKINKIRPKFHFLTKIEIKMTYLVFVGFFYLLSSGTKRVNKKTQAQTLKET